MDSAVRLSCEGQLAIIVQKNAKQRAIVNMQLGPMFSEVMRKISVAGLRAAHQQYQQWFSDDRDCQGMYAATKCKFLRSSASN